MRGEDVIAGRKNYDRLRIYTSYLRQRYCFSLEDNTGVLWKIHDSELPCITERDGNGYIRRILNMHCRHELFPSVTRFNNVTCCTHLNDEVKRITGKGLHGEVAAGGHQGLKAGPRSRDTATTHAACFISSPLRPASSL